LRWPEAWQSLRQIREHHFDWVLDLQGLFRSGVVAWLANGGLTVGLDDPREGAQMFYDRVVPRKSYHTHAVEWYLEAVAALQVPVHWNFQWLPVRKPVAASIREKWLVGDYRWIAIQPGARWMNKRWPVEHYIELVRQLAALDESFRFVILGSSADAVLGHAVHESAPARCLDLTGITTLPELVEWLRCSQLLITNDTGPMHIAAALRKPLVALFGPTEPRRTGPYGQLQNVLQPQNLPCAPCMKSTCHYERPLECLSGTQVFTVVNAARKILGV
jgi:lipopolysaccharide heptosyltransferase II